jgi:hypothetical protein
MSFSQPKIDVRLRADRVCYLSRQLRFSLVVFMTLHSDKPVTVVRRAGACDIELVDLLISEIIECFDTDSGERIPIIDYESAPQPSRLNKETMSLMSIEDRRSTYITLTTAENPRDYEFPFDSSRLRPDRNYTIRGDPSALQWWSYNSNENILEYHALHGKLPPTETPPLLLLCEPGSAISFDTRAEVPLPPKIDVSLSVPSTLSISNNPPFKFFHQLHLPRRKTYYCVGGTT